jgi:hypothetical protein
MVDLVGEDVGGVDRPVALDDRRSVLGRRRRDLLAAGAERVAAEDDGESSDVAILERGSPLVRIATRRTAALIRGGL